MTMDDPPNPKPDGRAVRDTSQTGPVYANVSRYYGALVAGQGTSFDAALARITDLSEARKALPVQVDDLAYSLAEIPRVLAIHVARPDGGRVMRAKQTHIWFRADDFHVTYKNSQYEFGKVYHNTLIEMLADQITAGGDSGSPVTNEAGNILMGMHIAGSGRKAFMIPAFELLWTGSYPGLSGAFGTGYLMPE